MSFRHYLGAVVGKVVPRCITTRAVRGVNRVRYRGDRCYCPICRSRLRQFLPHVSVDGIARENARCPVCGSYERHRQFWMFVEGVLPFAAGRTVFLHVAPEDCLRRRLVQLPGIAYVAGALTPTDGVRRLDLTCMDLPDGSIGFIYAGHVLNMIPDERVAIREVFRVLQPGGMAVLQVPIFREESIDYRGSDRDECVRLFGDPNMHHIFGKDLLDRFREAGFELVIVPYARLMSDQARRYFGIEKQDVVVCIKP